MKQLEEHQHLLNDPEALLEKIRDKGYIFLRGYLSKEKIFHIRNRVIDTLKKVNWVEPNSPKGQAIPVLPIRTFRSPEYDKSIPFILSLEEFQRFAYDGKLLAIMKQIIGTQVVAHATRVIRIINPTKLEKDSTVDVHQDYRYVQGTLSTYTAWIPLGDCPSNMGGLKILENSHKDGIRPILGLGKSKCGIVDVSGDHENWASTSYHAGDLLIFHSCTIHGPLPNQTSELRLSMDFRYQSIYEPICERALQPFCYPDVPNWDELSKDWSTRQWIEIPRAMTVIPYDKAIQNG